MITGPIVDVSQAGGWLVVLASLLGSTPCGNTACEFAWKNLHLGFYSRLGLTLLVRENMYYLTDVIKC